MFVKQVSVFLENAPGALQRLTRMLADTGIDLYALSIADTEHYGIVRMIVSDTLKCQEVLKAAGFTVRLTDALAVCVPDRPGGLADILTGLAQAKINVEYLYSFVRSPGSHALLIFHLSDLEAGRKLLLAENVRLLTQDQLKEL